jgi:DNA-binding CsgD family transcriptional regulator
VNGRLPEDLSRWLKTALAGSHLEQIGSGALQPLFLEGACSRLTIRLLPNHPANEHTLVLEERAQSVSYTVFEDYGLTGREAEVLNWVSQGKTNPEIAIILGISVKTVGHHVEHILAKLGVDRRASAALWAQQMLGTGSFI